MYYVLEVSIQENLQIEFTQNKKKTFLERFVHQPWQSFM